MQRDRLEEALRVLGELLQDWLNDGPTFLFTMGLPEGFAERVSTRRYGGLTLHLASRRDLITLKCWSATSSARGRSDVDVEDLLALAPSAEELREAVRWCRAKDGRDDFLEIEARPLLEKLGVDVGDVR